ncbi:MAG: hypothetical protein HRT68_04090 [Flavobacteriaceae bacterium]|nr:hypothetical protein [Flavobacteriaceae bacterium]
MDNKDCNKYFDKADRFQNDIDDLTERIEDLMSVPKSPTTNAQIKDLQEQCDQLADKKEEALLAGYHCVANQH